MVCEQTWELMGCGGAPLMGTSGYACMGTERLLALSTYPVVQFGAWESSLLI